MRCAARWAAGAAASPSKRIVKHIESTSRRADIQLLRGIAVLAVVLNHTSLNILRGGYLGVDVFFVISGFVIANSMLKQSLLATSARNFFLEFWIRRIFRLWPLLFLTVVTVSTILAATGAGLPGSIFTGVTSLFALSNYRLLLGRLEYFALDTESDWFMHTWSLAVEEQIYVVLSLMVSLAIWRARRRATSPRRTIAIVLTVLSSASLLSALVASTTELTRFYSAHTRLYQVGAGFLLALGTNADSTATETRMVRWSPFIYRSLIATLALLFVIEPVNGRVASLATTVVSVGILASSPAKNQPRSSAGLKWLVSIGDWSYAIYLMHWPLHLLWTELLESRAAGDILAVTTAVSLGAVIHVEFESRTRHLWQGWSLAKSFSVAAISLLVAVVAAGSSYRVVESASEPEIPPIAPAGCTRLDGSVWLVGDSHLTGTGLDYGISDFLDGNCRLVGGYGLILGFEDLAIDASGQRSLRISLSDPQSLINEVLTAEIPPKALLVTHFLTAFTSDPQAAPPSADFVSVAWVDQSGKEVSRTDFIRRLISNLGLIADELSARDGHLIITSPPPDFDWVRYPSDPNSCGLSFGRLCTQLRTPTQITSTEHKLRGDEIRQALNALAKSHSNVFHVPLDSPFCLASGCSNFQDGEPQFQDDDHLNANGVRRVLPLLEEALRQALDLP